MSFGTNEALGNPAGNLTDTLMNGPKVPGAPQLPGYPNLSPQQLQILQAQQANLGQFGQTIQGVSGQLGANQNILQQISGLFNSDGTINQNAVAQLQQMAGKSTQTAGAQGQSALQGLGGMTSSLGATGEAYQNALQGKVPQNQQLAYQQQQNFLAMQEQAAQQGIKITGTGWNDAVSESTAGQKLIQNFQQNANIQNQNYALGYTQQLAGNMGQIAGAGATQANTGMGLGSYSQQTPLGYVGQSITSGQGALAPFLSQYNQMAGSTYAPWYMQQQGPYQQQMAQAQANYQQQMQQYQANQGFMGGLGSMAGMGLGYAFGGPMGAMMGSQAGGMLGGGSLGGNQTSMLPWMNYMQGQPNTGSPGTKGILQPWSMGGGGTANA